jgi:signal transduction histidine kinase/pSer/pThr/pTyr-binding forkhead associated (FHA) protein
MATLFVMQGRDQGRRYELRDSAQTVGRDGTNRIQLADSEISRRHAEIRRDDDGYLLVDLASANGSFVNGQQVAERRLVNGDRVQLGRTLFLFTDADEAAESNLAHEVDIVGQNQVEGSRIVKSVSHESGSEIFAGEDAIESPWLARAKSNLQIMYRTALAVSHTLDIDQLLARIMDLIFEWVEADRGCVMLVDHETGELAPAVSRNRRGVQADERMTISRTILDYVLQHKEGVLTSDATDDTRWNPEGSIMTLGVREAICVPMQGRYGIVGVIYIDTYTPPGKSLPSRAVNRFSEEHLKLMVAIGHQAALAVEDTSYYSAMLQAERLAAMGQTIATLSHHIKNILQGIRGGSYLIEEGLKSEEHDVIRRGWRIVEKNQERISSLVMDMLTFSKDREPELVASNLNDTISDVVELLRARAAEAHVNLIWQPRTDLPEFLFDADLLHRAILNVAGNAIDACEKRGRESNAPTNSPPYSLPPHSTPDPLAPLSAPPSESTSALRTPHFALRPPTSDPRADRGRESFAPTTSPLVSASSQSTPDPFSPIPLSALPSGSTSALRPLTSDSPQVELSIDWSPGQRLVNIVVRDNGEGIPPEDLKKIFSVFESKKGSRGTGLGLPVSQKIMREHGGDIRVESTPGLGSRFFLELPAHTSEPRHTDLHSLESP